MAEWTITGAESYTSYFDTRRFVRRTYTSRFPLYRKVVNRLDDNRFPILSVIWNVEPQLPLEVDDTNWEGGGNTWPWTVFDNSGRPEPYAQIDFDKDGKNIASFQCDERGRINLNIPDDIRPGVYTFRQKGPSMAPQTIHDFVVVDPWMIYKHGHRHSADGPDPVYGITNEQIDDDANIHPSKIEGATSLGEIVNAYGSNIKKGLEEHMSSGHGFYVVSGLDYESTITSHLLIHEGVCWEDSVLRKIPETDVLFSEIGTYKIFVSLGIIRSEKRTSFPPTSTPLYTVTVTNPGTITVTVDADERLRHPDSVTTGTIVPVKWGAETTDDILHDSKNLKDLLNLRFSQIDERFAAENKIHNEFENKTDEIINNIQSFESDNRKAREAMLSVGFTTSMKQLYSYFNRQAANDLLIENSSNLLSNNMEDVVIYLTNVINGGLVHHSSHISAFQSGDELSSITNLLIRNGVGTLPNNWTRGTQYNLRTLRVEGAPAKYLDFHLIYEDTKANFRVLGSLNNEGRYVPKQMTKLKTVKDNRLKDTFGTTRDCFIDTYRTIFPIAGTESVIEVLITGGELPDGARIRGFSIVTG